MTPRLSEATLSLLPAWVRKPGPRPEPRVVHLGIGAFHRAHQALVFDDLGWGVTAASLRSPAVREAMAPQNGLFSLVTGEEVRVIGAVREVLLDTPELVARIAAPATRLMTLTVTEKGYLPGSRAVAILAEALAKRADGITIMSCDNLPRNGAVLREAVLAAAGDAAGWIAEHCAFPQTMVDRIVPATEEADVAALAGRIGLEDRAMVKTEPFTQWVIEDRFAAGERPDFAAVGVQIATDIAPWEEAKLRLLNGAHSGLAYLAGLAGIAFVHEAIATPGGRGLVEALWDEAEPTLTPPPGLDLAAYRAALLRRFADPGLRHRTVQIAMDGSQKLPQRLLAPIAARLARGQGIETLALAVAAWMRWQRGRTDAGEAFVVDDPLAAETARRLAGLDDPVDQVRALSGIEAIFPPALAADPRFQDALTRQLRRLAECGAKAVLAS
ncbi:mannitol dehydrogenase family protein [Allosphingosinicella sp.]|uniref:mannitol dehydrogenase family protein n=1 Tax=Allosphingosinicella sp. TaxID=2823234 RepID=UPI003784E5BD